MWISIFSLIYVFLYKNHLMHSMKNEYGDILLFLFSFIYWGVFFNPQEIKKPIIEKIVEGEMIVYKTKIPSKEPSIQESMENRLKNHIFWASTISMIYVVLYVPDKTNIIINSVLFFIVFLGIINNPETKNRGIGDDPF